jgi:Spy/CpxP family protein refolding chaperone
MKKILATVGIPVLAALIAVPALAQGPGYARGRGMMGPGPGDPRVGPGYGWAYDRLTDEQRGQLAELHQKHFDETARVRTELRAKQAELHILMNTSSPDLEKAKALQKEISELQGKMGQERINLYSEARKINPDLRFGRNWSRGGKGFGPCGEGYGPGTGRGWKRGGYGQGPRWN